MRIHAISTGEVDIKSKQVHGQGHSRFQRLSNLFLDPNWVGWVPIHVWVIDHPEGVIVVDAGDTAQPPKGWRHPFHLYAARKQIQPEQELGPQLAQLGIRPSDVRWLVLTHMHIDHDGGLSYFPKAQIMVSQGEYHEAEGLRGRLMGYVPQRWPDWFRPVFTPFQTQAIGPFERSYSLTKADDVLVIPTPGHTTHHQSVIVRDGSLSYFLAGDTSYTEQGMLEGWVDGVGPSEAQQLNTLKRIREYARTHPTIYLPAHDPGSAGRLEQKQTTGLETLKSYGRNLQQDATK